LNNDLAPLDRSYRTHQEIAGTLHQLVGKINSDVLLISIGESNSIQKSLSQKRILFEIGLRQLLQIPLDELNVSGLDISNDLEPIPNENSVALRILDPLWESIQLRLITIENNPLLSEEFGTALSELNYEKNDLLFAIDDLIFSWGAYVDTKDTQRQTAVQMVSIIDIIVFGFIAFSIRRTLNPLGHVTRALSKVKEGVYGQKIHYKSKDEIGDLIDTYNIMSKTILEKDQEAKRMDTAKDEFLTMITHELKTPLVPIQGYADILLSGHLGELTDKQKERLSIIKSSANSLLQLISDLLDAQKLELGQLRMKKDKSSIDATVRESINAILPEVSKKHIKLTYSHNEDIIIPHDSKRIGQVITNLVKNGINIVKPNTGLIEVFIVGSEKSVQIAIRDNGPGIPEKSLSKIFGKFFQVDTSLTREIGGSGLGLSICKGIVEAHGGKIWAENHKTGGATFIFTLPKTS